jgi:hypothetical protein
MDQREDRLTEEVVEEFKQHHAGGGGREVGGEPEPSDLAAPGGSSGSGGYRRAEDVAHRMPPEERAKDPHQSRGDRFDERANGGRGEDSVSFDEVREGDDETE